MSMTVTTSSGRVVGAGVFGGSEMVIMIGKADCYKQLRFEVGRIAKTCSVFVLGAWKWEWEWEWELE